MLKPAISTNKIKKDKEGGNPGTIGTDGGVPDHPDSHILKP